MPMGPSGVLDAVSDGIHYQWPTGSAVAPHGFARMGAAKLHLLLLLLLIDSWASTRGKETAPRSWISAHITRDQSTTRER